VDLNLKQKISVKIKKITLSKYILKMNLKRSFGNKNILGNISIQVLVHLMGAVIKAILSEPYGGIIQTDIF
jgi:hypothetical protein